MLKFPRGSCACGYQWISIKSFSSLPHVLSENPAPTHLERGVATHLFFCVGRWEVKRSGLISLVGKRRLTVNAVWALPNRRAFCPRLCLNAPCLPVFFFFFFFPLVTTRREPASDSAFADRSEKERARSGRWLGKDGRREEEEVRVWRAWSATRESTNPGSHLPQETLGGNRVC